MLLRVFTVVWLGFVSSMAFADDLEKFNQQLLGIVNGQLDAQGIPGAAYVVVKGKKIVALETIGYVDKAKSRKIDAHTVFRLASVSKTFAATIAIMLSQEQQLSLSDPVTKYVPQFTLAKKGAADKIQLKHLLSHSTGLMPNAYDNLLHENWSMDKIIGRFDKIKPICRPNLCYGYQNVAFSMIQNAIEASQPKNYAVLLQDRVFKPLKMTQASVGIDVFRQGKNTAKPHLLIKRAKTGQKDAKGHRIYHYKWRESTVTPDFYKVAPAAGVNASISDLAQWLIANMGYKPDVLSPQLLKELTTARIKTKKDMRRKYWKNHLTDAHYGYGWRIYEFEHQPIIYHSGWVAGFVAEVGYSPYLDIGFALLINAETNAISKISSEFWVNAHRLALPL